MSLLRRFAAVSTLVVLAFAAACGSDDPTGPTATPVIGVTVQAINSSSMRITFTSKAGDVSYNIERAEGATGTFARVGTVAAPATPGQVTYTDDGLQENTAYRYRVVTVIGSSTAASSEGSATTM